MLDALEPAAVATLAPGELARLGLPGTFHARRPHQLSHGQAQRVALARALAVRDHLLSTHPRLTPTLSVKARGACCFIAANDTLAGRTQNRRVELVFDLRDKERP